MQGTQMTRSRGRHVAATRPGHLAGRGCPDIVRCHLIGQNIAHNVETLAWFRCVSHRQRIPARICGIGLRLQAWGI